MKATASLPLAFLRVTAFSVRVSVRRTPKYSLQPHSKVRPSCIHIHTPTLTSAHALTRTFATNGNDDEESNSTGHSKFLILSKESNGLKGDSTLEELKKMNEGTESKVLAAFFNYCCGNFNMKLSLERFLSIVNWDDFSNSHSDISDKDKSNLKRDLEEIVDPEDSAKLLDLSELEEELEQALEDESCPSDPNIVFDFIEGEIKKNLHERRFQTKKTEGMFRDWKARPEELAKREFDSTAVIGLSDIPTEMNELLFSKDDCNSQSPPMGMLNAVSGTGKTTLLQYCETHFNQEVDTMALFVTFNGSNYRGDGTKLTADQGLAMRIAERFLCNEGHFRVMRNCWIKSDNLKRLINFQTIVWAMVKLLETTAKKYTYIFIDEAGLAGDEERTGKTATFYLKKYIDKVVGLTSPLRGGTENVLSFDGDDLKLIKERVRFVVSSLTPVFNNDDLVNDTRTGGPIKWIDVPHADGGDLWNDEAVVSKVTKECEGLALRMHPDEFQNSMRLLIALASGHWRTLTKLTALANEGAELVEKYKSKWLKTIYLWNVRDVLVMKEGIADTNFREFNFEKLLKYAILHKPVNPFATMWKADEDSENNQTLVDLAYGRAVLNRFPVKEETFQNVTPHLSLLDVRQWCHDEPFLDNEDFLEMIGGILKIAGNDPTNPTDTVNSCKFGKTFELTAAYFLVAKLLALKDIEPEEQAYSLGAENNEMDLVEQILFPGHRVVCGENHKISVSSSKPRILQVKDTGFHHKKVMPNKIKKGIRHFMARRSWTTAALAQISIHDLIDDRRTAVTRLNCGDLLLPGSQNQPHSDALLVTELSCGKTGLLFLRYKFSESESTTTLSLNDIQKGLDRLLEERNVLFGNGLKYKRPNNQIAALKVEERHVIYCWSVLRRMPENTDAFYEKIRKYAKSKEFKGTILIAENSLMYGRTFRNLAVVFSGV